MKLAGRMLSKGDTTYDTRPVGHGKVQNGFQSTVQLPCLPGEWASALFTGPVCQNKQLAEQAAANIACSELSQDPDLAQRLQVAAAPKAEEKNAKSAGKGNKGMAGKQSWGMMN